jgi:hypothetical protein
MLPLVIRPFLFICLFLPFDTLLISTFIVLGIAASIKPAGDQKRERDY